MSGGDATRELEIRVRGMSCEGCADTVSKAARGVAGVDEASVDLASGVVKVKVRSDIDRREITEAIRAAGYEAA